MTSHTLSLYIYIFLSAVSPDVADLGSVLQVPTVGNLVLPAHVPGVLPQQTHLVVGVTCVPKGVPQVLTWTRLRLHSLGDSEGEKVRSGKYKNKKDESYNEIRHTHTLSWMPGSATALKGVACQ